MNNFTTKIHFRVFHKKNVKFIISGIFTLAICFTLHAEEVDNNLIYYGNAEIYGKENVFVEQNIHNNTHHNQKSHKAENRLTNESTPHNENDNTVKESIILLSDFPSAPSSPFSSYSVGICELLIVSQQNSNKYLLTGIVRWEKIYLHNKNSDLTEYSPKRRQKFSTAAIQYGELTFFGSQSPPELSLSILSLRA